jgi:hypothetical protein
VDRSAAARGGIDLQLSAGQRDALLHAEPSLAVALGGPPQSGARVEATAKMLRPVMEDEKEQALLGGRPSPWLAGALHRVFHISDAPLFCVP